MSRSIRDFATSPPPITSTKLWNLGSVAITVSAVIISAVTLVITRFQPTVWGLSSGITVLCAAALVHARFISMARVQHRESSELLITKVREFQSVFENTLDAILVVDSNGICQDANPSSSELLGSPQNRVVGRSIRLFCSNPNEFDAVWQGPLSQKRLQGEAELVSADGATFIAEFTVATHFLPNRHVMIFRNITARRRAQRVLAQSLVVARSSWLEADALRRATLALTEDLRMDHVLDTLLKTLSQFVPYEQAQLFLFESDSRLLLARQAAPGPESAPEFGFPETLELSGFPIFSGLLENQDGLLVDDTSQEQQWRAGNKRSRVRSWIGVPIRSSSQVLGVLSLAHSTPAHFSRDHLRLTRSLATSAAVAIQNARLYERAEIYATELKGRFPEACVGKSMPREMGQERRTTDKWFQTVFRSAPVAMAVTSLAEGKFLEVNEAFERRFGFRRSDIWGRTTTELGLWEDPLERTDLINRLRRGARVRAEVARLRSRSGIYQATVYSAELVDFDGQPTLLVATDDSRDLPPLNNQN